MPDAAHFKCPSLVLALALLLSPLSAAAAEKPAVVEPFKPFSWSDSIPEAFAKAIALESVTAISLRPFVGDLSCHPSRWTLLSLSKSDAAGGVEQARKRLLETVRQYSVPPAGADRAFFVLTPLDGLPEKAWFGSVEALCGCVDSVPIAGVPYSLRLDFAPLPSLALDPAAKTGVELTAPDELFPYRLIRVILRSESAALGDGFAGIWDHLVAKYPSAGTTHNSNKAKTVHEYFMIVDSKPPVTGINVHTDINTVAGSYRSQIVYTADTGEFAKRWQKHVVDTRRADGRKTAEDLKGKGNGLEGGL